MARHRPPTAARNAPRVRRWQAGKDEPSPLGPSMPPGWRGFAGGNLATARPARALRAIIDLDQSEIMVTEPPRGFGRD